jgi:uncharacterized damage-inducible protein DinB
MLKGTLHGVYTHIDPFEAIQGLSHEEAIQRPIDDSFSSWENLFHIIIWQETILEALQGKKINWTDLRGEDRPKPHHKNDPEFRWEALILRFKQGIEKIEKQIDKSNLEKPLDWLGNVPTMKPFLIIAQHNSYHFGQLAKNRKAQGTWPPPGIKDY